MPKQHTLFGRPVPRVPPKRISFLLVCISIFAIFSLLFTLPSAVPTGPNLGKFTDLKSSIPSKFKGAASSWKSYFHPFKPPAHPPPRQQNDTYGDSSWYSNWKWLSIPFSSSLTLDENRALLPPLQKRQLIYCYYDHTLEKDKGNRDAESELLLTWRRAWWAQGFRPIILSAAEAMNNPMYEELQRMKLNATLKTDVMRWLAWENMGGGLLSHYLLFPMAAHEDALLSYLRRGEFPGLTRWKGLDDALFAGPRQEIAAAIKLVMANPKVGESRDFLDAVGGDGRKDQVFTVDGATESVALYNGKALEAKYPKVAEVITAKRAEGLAALNQLVRAHLQVTWQNIFSDGVAVLKPSPEHTAYMVKPALTLAMRLAACLPSPDPGSCPPNRAKCRPCSAERPMKVSTPGKYRNATTLYTIGTVPHPYTFQSLTNLRERLEVPWVRRESRRDAWLEAAMQDLVAAGVSSGPRVLRLKEAVAGESASAHGLWIPAERDLPDDLDWHFGFPLPEEGGKAKADAGSDGAESVPPEKGGSSSASAREQQQQSPLEPELLEKAKKIRFSKERADVAVREAIEAWNLADTEAWRFARAFLLRAWVERLKWKEEESKYAGGAGAEKGRRHSVGSGTGLGLGRWLERRED